ncbi:SDR family oxidoreductase [Cellulosimicrobium composti]|uniref:SDR family oxidoreductase n=1 Tax=Cellulosimicrobium composti TaxID=2672572 RepID=A0ABX0B8E0_9MICO|nr:SDR family oxidoreductase [Cellulosimicrobium composti]NDO88905.1 SDR family oxidoreductase [Cellulosimicrobium composti]TWG78372.1 putative NADH-flavin reductase [Cellulosimicrobium cellulans J34]SMF05548.1 Putative NADH-flavin reductase [Cellulosimicrobium cellulans J1]
MKIALVGAHGKVGRLLVPILVGHGASVSGIVRADEQLPLVRRLGGEPLLLDVEHAETEEIAAALDGFDAVVWSAGAGGGDRDRTYAVDRDAAGRSMDAAAAAGVGRYVMVSWIGSVPDHGVDPDSSFFAYADAKLAADDHLRGTGLDWTVLGPGTLTDDDPTGAIRVVGDGPDGLDGAEDVPSGAASRVSRADVAMVVAQTLRTPATVGRFIRFTGGDTPILEALER